MHQENDRKMIIILPTCIKYLPHLQLIKNKRTVELNAQGHTHSLVVMMHNENTNESLTTISLFTIIKEGWGSITKT